MFNKWLVSWGTPSLPSTPGEIFLETSSVKASHFKKGDDMQEITGIEPYSACKKFQPGSATQEQTSLLLWVCCVISHKPCPLQKKKKLKTQKRRGKKNFQGPQGVQGVLVMWRSVSLSTQSQNRPNQHISLQDYTLLIHHISCSREAICSHALPRAERRQYRTLHTTSVVSWHQLPIALLT